MKTKQSHPTTAPRGRFPLSVGPSAGLPVGLPGRVLGMLLFAIGSFVVAGVGTDGAAGAFDAGNRAYDEGRYEEAAAHYASAIAGRGLSASLLYNMGNAHAHAGKIGLAVLAYERALMIRPDDADIRANLDRVRRRGGLYETAAPILPRVWRLQSQNRWAWIGFGALLAMGILFLGKGLAPIVRKRSEWERSLPAHVFGRAVVGVMVLLVVAGMGIAMHARDPGRSVVLDNDVRLLVSPNGEAENGLSVREGAIVRIEQRDEGHAFVRLPSGDAGWIAFGSVEPVIP